MFVLFMFSRLGLARVATRVSVLRPCLAPFVCEKCSHGPSTGQKGASKQSTPISRVIGQSNVQNSLWTRGEQVFMVTTLAAARQLCAVLSPY